MKHPKTQNIPKLSEKKQIEFDILYKTLIGKHIKILESSNQNQIGIGGTIVYESANLLYIKTNQNTIKKILKKSITIELEYNNHIFKINCNLLKNTLIQRIKKIK